MDYFRLAFSESDYHWAIVGVMMLVGAVFSIMLHEVAHGFAAWKAGDPTAKYYGRMTLNPLKHFDLFGFACFVVIGFGCAPIYPSIIHSTPNNFGAENSGAIIGIQMASAYVGSTFIPPLFGLLGNHIGFKILPVYLIVFVALMITMLELTFKVTAKKKV